MLAAAPKPPQAEGWRFDMENAPTTDFGDIHQTVIVAFEPESGERLSAEAYRLKESGEWWRAGEMDGDEYASPIDPPPYAWMSLPTPPVQGSGT
jgi:hypothetical protein